MSNLEYKEEIKKEIQEKLDNGTLFRTIKTISNSAKDPCPLWSNYFFRQAVTVEVGDPGIGKTTFDYSLLTALSLGKSFLGITPPAPIKSLYMDFESADSLVKIREKRMNVDGDFPDFMIMNWAEYSYENLEEFLPIIKEKAFDFDMLFVDNMLTAFDTSDENDNAEAKKKVKKMRILAEKLNISIVILHHPSKANAAGTRKGSGAFAWARHGDILLNFNETSDPDIIEIETAKNRWAEDKISMYIKKCGDCVFELTKEPNKNITLVATDLENAKRYVLEFDGVHTRREILEHCIANNISESTANTALWELFKANNKLVMRAGYGSYQINRNGTR